MKEKICFDKFGVMIDCSRNAVMNVSAFKKMADILSSLGYNTIRLYTEDTYEVDGEPYFGYLRGRYSKAELRLSLIHISEPTIFSLAGRNGPTS